MIKFEKIQPGMRLYDVRKADWRGRMASGKRYSVWDVYVREVDVEKRRVFASWNGNAPKWMSEREVTKYRGSPPK